MFKGLLLALVLVGASAMAAQPEAVPGEYVVKLKKQASLKSVSLAGLAARIKLPIKKVVSEDLGLVLIKDSGAAIKNFAANPDIEYIEPNYIYRILATPNDPQYGQLWGLKNVGQEVANDEGLTTSGVAGIDIAAEQAWEITKGSKDVIVAVIDTGVQYDHQDLKDNMWTNTAELNGKAGVDDDKNGYVDDVYGVNFITKTGNPMDDHGHGSHCSGTIGAKGDNNLDVVGVNWNVRIMALKFLSAQGSGSLDDAVSAIQYATKMGAHIMSNSWGGGPYSKAMEDAIKAAAAKGILFVAAAGNHSGNNDSSPTYPATYQVENVVSVAALNSGGTLADFSCYGAKTVHVAAPGVKILSTTPSGLKAWSGTSMATPHVSGVAALLKAANPNITAVEMKARLTKTAQPLPSLKGKVSSAGLVNAYNALTNTTPPPDVNDPANWPAIEYQLSTEHPYANNAVKSFEIKVPGAKKFAVHFAKFDFEAGYDFVKFTDASGKEIGSLTGFHDDDFAPVVEGDSVTVTYTSDNSVAKYGFDIDKIAVKGE